MVNASNKRTEPELDQQALDTNTPSQVATPGASLDQRGVGRFDKSRESHQPLHG